MSDQTPQPTEDDAVDDDGGAFQILRIYTRDISFETPNSPEVFGVEWTPQTEINMRTEVKPLKDSNFEVTLAVTAEAKLGERTAFLAEVHQAGIFKVAGLTREELGPVLGSYCPSILFPYVREAISDLVTRGGFPPMLLAPVNFDAIFAQREEAQAGASAPQPGDAG